MTIDYVYIMAAGFGTRMGEIGKVLPKVLWPIFEKTLVELQVEYAKKFNPKEMFINLHHQREEILNFISEKDLDLTVLVEDEILDVGGAVLNLAKHTGYSGNVLILNADQFLMFDDKDLDRFVSGDDDCHKLCLIKKIMPERYNQVSFDENHKFKNIVPYDEIVTNDFYTYSGMSIINLSSFSAFQVEKRNFWEVLKTSSCLTDCYTFDDYEYIDFGTKAQYFENMFKVLSRYIKSEKLSFFDFLIKSNAFKTNKVTGMGYGTNDRSINLSNSSKSFGDHVIRIAGDQIASEQRVLIYNDLTDHVT